jgi:hypothetical protein
MKTIELEQTDRQIAETLKQQDSQEPVLLTKGSNAIWLLLKLPEGTKEADVDGVFRLEGPAGRVLVIIEARYGPQLPQETGLGRPVFGSCKGMLTVMSEDDEHLKDFEDYLK